MGFLSKCNVWLFGSKTKIRSLKSFSDQELYDILRDNESVVVRYLSWISSEVLFRMIKKQREDHEKT